MTVPLAVFSDIFGRFLQPCFGVMDNPFGFGLGGPPSFLSNGLALGGQHLGWPAYVAMEPILAGIWAPMGMLEPILAGIWAPMGMRAGPMEPILAGMTFGTTAGMALPGGQAGMGQALPGVGPAGMALPGGQAGMGLA